MKLYHLILLLVASVGILSSCAVETVRTGPAYAEVYAPVYGSYPSYDWGYHADYYPAYEPVVYYGYGGWY
jgi:hypothetical protein